MINVINFLKSHNIQSVLDIGANTGDWSLNIKRHIPDIKLYCIEANPACEHYLHEKNLNYFMSCLSDRIQKVKFYMDPNTEISTGCSYYLENTKFFNDSSYIELETKTLDSIVTGSYEYIKFDTQGSEIDIFRGGMNTISKSKYLQVETSLIEYNKKSPLKEEVFAFLSNMNFKPLYLVENHYMDGQIIQEDFIFEKIL